MDANGYQVTKSAQLNPALPGIASKNYRLNPALKYNQQPVTQT
jgi:hypothetical protein